MPVLIPSPRLARTGSLGPLSEAIIPTTPGKFYVYQSLFTDGKPLYALLDCKANKARPLAHAGKLGREVHLHVGFTGKALARLSSMKAARAAGLLGNVNAALDDVSISVTDIAIEDFYALSAKRDMSNLVTLCSNACSRREDVVEAVPGTIVAVMTSRGKYGLVLVKEISSTHVSIDACHIEIA